MRRLLFCVTSYDHCGDLLVMFLTWASSLRQLAIQNLPGHAACTRIWAHGRVFFPLPEYMHELVRSTKVQGLDEWTLFDHVLSLLAVRHLKEFN